MLLLGDLACGGLLKFIIPAYIKRAYGTRPSTFTIEAMFQANSCVAVVTSKRQRLVRWRCNLKCAHVNQIRHSAARKSYQKSSRISDILPTSECQSLCRISIVSNS